MAFDTPTIEDDFLSLNPANWVTYYPDADAKSPDGHQRTLAGNQEAEWYADANVSTGPGGLVFTGIKQSGLPESTTCSSGMIYWAGAPIGDGYTEWTFQVPTGNSDTWPALWCLFEGGWPPEDDLLEMPNGPTQLFITEHSKDGSYTATPPQGWPITVADLSTGYHTLARKYDSAAKLLTAYLDGKQIAQTPMPSDMVNAKRFWIANLAIGGTWPSSYGESFPTSAKYFYIARFRHWNMGWASGGDVPAIEAKLPSATPTFQLGQIPPQVRPASAGSTTVTPTPAHAASPALTTLTAPGGVLWNAGGVEYALVGSSANGQQYTAGGKTAAGSKDVVALVFTGQEVRQWNQQGAWWTAPPDGSDGVPSSAPPGWSMPTAAAPTPAPAPASSGIQLTAAQVATLGQAFETWVKAQLATL